ncbi:MAG TPA: serine hydrolase [Methylomirabilota bacterium]|nr:serine hydrolase [Methylomirabilota bacterium]
MSARAALAGVLLLVVTLAGCSSRAGHPLRVATGYISHVVCSYVFVSGLDPGRVSEEDVAANPAFNGLHWALRHEVDRQARAVTARALGGFESRAVYRDGLGCLNVTGAQPADAPTRADIEAEDPIPARLPEIAGPAVVTPASPALAAALDAAFADPAARRTHAIVVVHDGRVIAERYADGFGVDTPVHGWSATKSINNALLGVLVRQGKLDMTAPAPVAAWGGAADGRRAITPDALLRMASGLDLGDSLTAGLKSGWDVSARMAFNEADMAGFATGATLATAPGRAWAYANGNTAILGRIVRDRTGGRAVDVLRFARRELFGPLGMRQATLEVDATGSPIGGAFFFATPRDWARFGLLFLDDGKAGDRRILPEGWVRYSTTPTPGAWVGYGAGWWINDDDSRGARFRREHGMPADAFMAMGIYGQTVVVVPSARVVIARFGTTYDLRQATLDIARLTADVTAAVHARN